MDSHSKTYEQFCWVKQRNIIMEETVFHNGRREIICTNLSECDLSGGCRNKSLCKLWQKKQLCAVNSDKMNDGECAELTNGK